MAEMWTVPGLEPGGHVASTKSNGSVRYRYIHICPSIHTFNTYSTEYSMYVCIVPLSLLYTPFPSSTKINSGNATTHSLSLSANRKFSDKKNKRINTIPRKPPITSSRGRNCRFASDSRRARKGKNRMQVETGCIDIPQAGRYRYPQ